MIFTYESKEENESYFSESTYAHALTAFPFQSIFIYIMREIRMNDLSSTETHTHTGLNKRVCKESNCTHTQTKFNTLNVIKY